MFQGWGNYTALEIEWLAKVKAELKNKYNVDLDQNKAFGPRVAHGAFKEGSRQPQSGADLFLTD